jgi:hypothetical protein
MFADGAAFTHWALKSPSDNESIEPNEGLNQLHAVQALLLEAQSALRSRFIVNSISPSGSSRHDSPAVM